MAYTLKKHLERVPNEWLPAESLAYG
jgi:hypothetical protein